VKRPTPKQPKGLDQRQEGFCDGEGRGPKQPGRGVTYNQGFKAGRANAPKPAKRP
jgi:hypothetical protein